MSAESSYSPDTGLEKTKKSPQSSFDAEKQNRENINILTTKISTALGTKFDQKDIPFDISTFKKNLNQSIEKVFLDPNIPNIAKEKFKQDILAKIDLLAQVTLSDINTLRTRRNIESGGVWEYEMKQKFGNDETKIKAHHLGMILNQTIGKYVQPTADGLVAAFSDKRESKGQNEYHGKTLETFSGSIQQLDTKYGLNMSTEIEKIANDFKRNTKGDISREDIYRQIGIKIVDALNTVKRIPDASRVKQFIMNGNLTERSKGGKLTEALTPSGTKDVVDIVLEYKEAIRTFQGTEREVREARSTALSDGVGSKMKDAVGMEGLKSEFDHLKSEDIEKKMKNASLADFVIMGTQLAQIVPILGDIGGGSLDIGSAITGISSDGAKLSKVERAFSGIFGTLGLTVFLGWLSRAKNAGKIAGIILGLRIGAKYLPDKIDAFLKAGGKLSEQTKAALSSFGKMMGKEVSLKIEQMMLKNGGMMAFTEPIKQFSFLSLVGSRQKAFYETTGGETFGILVQLKDGAIGLSRGEHNGKQIVDICEERKGKLVVIGQKLVSEEEIVKLAANNDNSGGVIRSFLRGKMSEKFFEQFDIMSRFQEVVMPAIKSVKNDPFMAKMSAKDFVQKIIQENAQEMFQKLSPRQQKIVSDTLESLVTQTQKVRKYLTDLRYCNGDDHRQLAADIFKVDVKRLKGKVTANIDPPAIVLYVEYPEDYHLLSNFGDIKKAQYSMEHRDSGGLAFSKGNRLGIPELEGSLTLINGHDWRLESYGKVTQRHETQHRLNSFMMMDYGSGKPIVWAKDEMLAYLRDGRGIIRIEEILTKNRDLYDYFEHLKGTKKYEVLWKEYTMQVQEALNVVYRLQTLNIPYYLDILAITPIEHWSQVEKIYSGTASQEEKIRLHFQLLKAYGVKDIDMVSLTRKALLGVMSTSFVSLIGVVGYRVETQDERDNEKIRKYNDGK